MAVLTVDNVTKQKGKYRILKGICFKVERGEIVGFIGANGAGKTTTMKCIMDLCSYGGNIDTDGVGMEKISALIEEPSFYKNMSGKENLEINRLYYNDVDSDRCDELIKSLEMEKYIDRKVKHYSLGMKQRLGLAIALLNNPDILLLDEPMNGLDPDGVMQLRNLLGRLAHEEKKAILVSSHILAEMQNLCDRAIFIKDGIIVGEEEPLSNLEQRYIQIMGREENV